MRSCADRESVTNNTSNATVPEQPETTELRLQCLTYDERATVLPAITEAVDRAGGWILDRRTMAAHALELRIELQVRALIDVYAAVVSSGVELTREAHMLLTERCLCRQYQSLKGGLSTILSIQLEIAFLAHLPIQNDWAQWVRKNATRA